ncbi:MAG: hypothetical protein HEP71_22195 [Roseivirga sp.]|nr:hypothetical protein [Roseivirga sp.]
MKLILRSLKKYGLFNALNIAGLTIAICCTVVIFQYVSFELSFDRFHDKPVYRVINDRYQNGELRQHSMLSYSAVGPALLDEIPEVVNQTRMFPEGRKTIRQDDETVIEIEGAVGVENGFFEMFSYQLLAGRKEEIFLEPYQLVLPRQTVYLLFGNKTNFDQLVGRFLNVELDNRNVPFEIVGVVEDLPENTHLQYKLFFSYATVISGYNFPEAAYDWSVLDFRHYVQLADGIEPSQLTNKLKDFSDRHFDNTDDTEEVFSFQSVKDIYLDPDKVEYGLGLTGDRNLIYSLSALALIILVLGWINFINMNLALSLEQAKTVSIRKILGAQPSGIKRYYIYENLVVNFLAIFLGLALSLLVTELLIQHDFEVKRLKELIVGGFLDINALITLVSCMTLGLALSSWYKARLATKVQALEVLKSRSSHSGRLQKVLAKWLMIFQYTVSIVFFSIGLAVFGQHELIMRTDLGMDLSNIVVLRPPKYDSTFHSRFDAFKNSLISQPQVKSVSTAQRIPGQLVEWDNNAAYGPAFENTMILGYIAIDNDYLHTYGIELLAGRNFERSDIRAGWFDNNKVLINETALAALQIENPAEAIGKKIRFFNHEKEIIGVTRDFRQRTLQYPSNPLLLVPQYAGYQIAVKLTDKNTEALKAIEALYRSHFPASIFSYVDQEDDYNANYASIDSSQKAFSFFTVVAILISVFGLISIAFVNLNTRVKELSLRKVLGAGKTDLIFQVNRRYLFDILIAALIGIPLAYMGLSNWLGQFEQTINLGPLYFIVPLVSLIVLLSIIVTAVTLKASASDPAKVLRSE